jgi:hypothetical protein
MTAMIEDAGEGRYRGSTETRTASALEVFFESLDEALT